MAILIRRESQKRLAFNAPSTSSVLAAGCSPRCDLGFPSSTCYAFFLLTHSHWQPCCCFASLHFVPSFGSRALDSFTTILSWGIAHTRLWFRF